MPKIEPPPPRVRGLPWIGAGLSLLRNPTEFFRRERARLGDSFVADVFGYRLFCVFSGQGVRRLYELPENEASFGLATFELVFRHKIPTELVIGRRNRPHDLFANQEVEGYLGHLEDAVAREIARLGRSGRFEIFALARRLGYRMGLAAWAGAEAASEPWLSRLIPAFDRLDSSDSFVRPAQLVRARATGKRRELRAMHEIEAVIAEILARRRAGGERHGDFLERIDLSFADLASGEREVAVARDLMLIQMGAQSNLYAALAWTLVNLLLHPRWLEPVLAGDDRLLERCAYESIRLAQRSITLRRVMQPIELYDGVTRYRLEPGSFLTTMLSVTNPAAAEGLDVFDPDHYSGRRLSDSVALPTRELVSTFGHGRHACPAQRFSISAIRIAVRRLLEHYELAPRFRSARPRTRQIGGVARAERPCRVDYRSRAR